MTPQTIPILPEWTRWSWAGIPERNRFAPLVNQLRMAWLDIERLSVVDGMRMGALQYVKFSDLPKMDRWAYTHEVRMVPITAANMRGSGGLQSIEVTENPDSLHVMFVKPEHYDTAIPLDRHNHRRVATLLGYPTCCQDAYEQTWSRGQVDSTYEAFMNTPARDASVPNSTPYAHSLLRWLGIRTGFHIPCSHACVPSQKIAEEIIALGNKYGYVAEMRFLEEAMRWPIKWSRLFGIAEIVTPVIKISTRTDWTSDLQSFTHAGIYTKPSPLLTSMRKP